MQFSTTLLSFVLAAVSVTAAPVAQFANLDGFKDQTPLTLAHGFSQSMDWLDECPSGINHVLEVPLDAAGSRCRFYLAPNPDSNETGYLQVATHGGTVEPDVSKKPDLWTDNVADAAIDQVVGTFALGPKGELPKYSPSGSWEWDCIPGQIVGVRLTAKDGAVWDPATRSGEVPPGAPEGTPNLVRFGIQVLYATPPAGAALTAEEAEAAAGSVEEAAGEHAHAE